ncbi:hypothetical protein [Fulvivirga sedimenti]|uniref:Uncharacterized protein n=1 Tax=Fulvivirga sedimenti TaxID=2879465 RepID=A0A9X1HL74_9BACT|nr:hypothetical protein [Fulvivirga sedimenti]MCA6074218.1 hypothetical protein [Fulvivirga sedimenti]
MDSSIRRDVMKDYSKRFANKVADDFFADHEKIASKDVMNVQEIKQVNLFVVKNLYDQWQRESDELRSPFFDYSSPEIKEAMQVFMNKLSHHISLNRKTYGELLEKSTEETLLLIFTPYDFYFRLLSEYDKDEIPVSYLSYVLKYVKINPHILRNILEIIAERNLEKIEKGQINELLDKSLERTAESPEDVEQYIEKFSGYVSLSLEEIYGEDKKKEIRKAPDQAEEKKKEKNTGHKPTLNDLLQKDEVPTLADIHRRAKIEDIKKSLSINQRFMFVNTLFNGSEEAFERTVEHIESVSNSEEAISFLTHKFTNWDHDSEEVSEFIQLIRRRHS